MGDTSHLIEIVRARTPEEQREISRKAGSTISHRKIASSILNLHTADLTPEQVHFITLMKNDQFATAIKDMLIFIATKAKTADDYHKLLNQIMKVPFIAKLYQDIEKEKQKDVIPIVVECLRDHGREDIIDDLLSRLRKAGWGHPRTEDLRTVQVHEVRQPETKEDIQDGIVADSVDEA